MDDKKRSIDESKPLVETEASSKATKHTKSELQYEEKPASSPPIAREIAAVLQSSPEAFFHQMAAIVLETSVDGEELMRFLQSKSKWLPVSVIVEHILPLLDRVSRNRLCSTYKELYAASRKVHTPWPFKRRMHTDGQRGSVYSVAFSPDSELLASGGDDGIIRIWDRADGLCTRLEGHADTVNSLCFSPDGKLLASAGIDAIIRVWKLEDRSLSRVLEGHRGVVRTVTFYPDGSTLVSGDYAGNIRLWDLINDGRFIRELDDEHIHLLSSVTLAPDGETIAAAGCREDEDGGAIGAIVLWDISDAHDISSAIVVDSEQDGEVHSLQYSPDGRYFASGADNGTVRLWNAADNSCAIVMKGNRNPVYSIAFYPNGKLLASTSACGSVRLWDVEDGDGSCLVNLVAEHHARNARSVAFSPDGKTLASNERDGSVCLWNPHEEDRKQFSKYLDWKTVFSLWNVRKE